VILYLKEVKVATEGEEAVKDNGTYNEFKMAGGQ